MWQAAYSQCRATLRLTESQNIFISPKEKPFPASSRSLSPPSPQGSVAPSRLSVFMDLPVLGVLSELRANWTERPVRDGTGNGSQRTTFCEPCLAFTGKLAENFPCWVVCSALCKLGVGPRPLLPCTPQAPIYPFLVRVAPGSVSSLAFPVVFSSTCHVELSPGSHHRSPARTLCGATGS